MAPYGTTENSQTAVVMVPLPAQGHLNQLLHLSRLLAAANLSVYYIGDTTHVRQARLRVHGWNDSGAAARIHFQEFEPAPFQTPPPNPNSSNKFPDQLIPAITAAMSLRDPITAFVGRLSADFRRVVVIFDSLMSYVVQDLDSVSNAEAYCFRSVSAFTAYAIYWERRGMPAVAPGAEILREVPGSDGCFSPEFLEYSKHQQAAKKIFCADIYNSCNEIEGFFLDLLEKEKSTGAGKVWALGPFHPVSKLEPAGSACLEWLDRQEPDSVIFVSFGSTTSMSDEQIREIAAGLERSRQKFLWVLRDADKGDIFTGDIRKLDLPQGFEGRTKKQGIILRDWAPQLEILGHPSTGGFMSHCGWNSSIESISMGVPIAAWPMHSDQPRNAVLLTKLLRVGLEVRDWESRDEIVRSNVVENVVMKLMAWEEGNEIRKRARELGIRVRESAIVGGTSRTKMEAFIAHITR
ncbi:zeatin O-xylosyltransferase-like isoform X1 [Andrographis paniculata]|uniref:zeatin O-xylosyltransferase-like isoform X1 n=1 Tax=Andrographis paniculata TaxID=175694 RepID=UPI0021E801BD|nr:zeatin O-xylosyltransferase-like isoform X1 [Andrographis paniculata]